MALILMLLGCADRSPDSRLKGEPNPTLRCANPHCITKTERGIKKLFVGETCAYCDQRAKKRG